MIPKYFYFLLLFPFFAQASQIPISKVDPKINGKSSIQYSLSLRSAIELEIIDGKQVGRRQLYFNTPDGQEELVAATLLNPEQTQAFSACISENSSEVQHMAMLSLAGFLDGMLAKMKERSEEK